MPDRLGSHTPDAASEDGILLMAVQYGLWKNKGHRHLKASYRPVTVGAALPGVESAAAQRLLSTSLEVSEYSPEVSRLYSRASEVLRSGLRCSMFCYGTCCISREGPSMKGGCRLSMTLASRHSPPTSMPWQMQRRRWGPGQRSHIRCRTLRCLWVVCWRHSYGQSCLTLRRACMCCKS